MPRSVHNNNHGNLRGPPQCHPARNKALLRDYYITILTIGCLKKALLGGGAKYIQHVDEAIISNWLLNTEDVIDVNGQPFTLHEWVVKAVELWLTNGDCFLGNLSRRKVAGTASDPVSACGGFGRSQDQVLRPMHCKTSSMPFLCTRGRSRSSQGEQRLPQSNQRPAFSMRKCRPFRVHAWRHAWDVRVTALYGSFDVGLFAFYSGSGSVDLFGCGVCGVWLLAMSFCTVCLSLGGSPQAISAGKITQPGPSL